MCYILTSFACWCAGKKEAIFDKFQAMERGLTPYPLEITKKIIFSNMFDFRIVKK